MFLLLLACAPDLAAPAAWALNEASLLPSSTGLDGIQVWTFYAEGWDRRQDPDHRQCSLIQDVQGEAMARVEGCLRCVAMYAVTLRELETDCPEGVIDGVVLDGLRAIGVGEPHPDLAADDPLPGQSLGWYLSFDGEEAMAHGWAWPESGEEVRGDGWETGLTYTFQPAYAWELGPR